jgi:hypothetical protein
MLKTTQQERLDLIARHLTFVVSTGVLYGPVWFF